MHRVILSILYMQNNEIDHLNVAASPAAWSPGEAFNVIGRLEELNSPERD